MALIQIDKRHNTGFPIVVGITGHRDPAHPERVAACIRDGLRQISARWPQSDIVGLSPLADGVDRIFAHEVLDAGHRLRVALPMPAETYVQDFSPDSRVEFDALCARAELVAQAPPVSGMEPGDDPRTAQYLAVGFYVAQSCHIMFAGWDGRINGLIAGTAHIVHARLSGVYDRVADLDVAPNRQEADVCPASHLTYLIRTERKGADRDAPDIDFGADAKWGLSPKALRGLAGRDRLSEVSQTASLDQMVRMGRRLNITDVPDHDTDGIGRLRAVRDAVEANADRYISRERARLPLLLLFAILAVGSFSVYGDFYDLIQASWVLLIVYALSLAGIAGLAQLQSKRLTSSDPTGWRRLAEALRVVIAWHRAGVGVPWDELKPGSAFRLTRRDDWVDCALRAHLIGYNDPAAPKGGVRDLSTLETEWVDDQIAYFENKDSQTARLDLMHRLGGMAFLIGILCVLGSGYFEFTQTTGSPASRIVWFMAGAFPAIGALLSGYAAVLEQSTPTSERDRMLLMFRELKSRLEAYGKESSITPHKTRRLRSAIITVGRSALAEVQNWSELTNDAIRKARDVGR